MAVFKQFANETPRDEVSSNTNPMRTCRERVHYKNYKPTRMQTIFEKPELILDLTVKFYQSGKQPRTTTERVKFFFNDTGILSAGVKKTNDILSVLDRIVSRIEHSEI